MSQVHPDVSAYISNAPEEQQAIMKELRKIISAVVPHVVEEYKWSRPVFRTTKDFAYLKTAKGYVTFGFFDFEKIKESEALLEGTGKDMRHIKIRKLQDINKPLLTKWLQALTRS